MRRILLQTITLAILVGGAARAFADPKTWDYVGNGTWQPATRPTTEPIDEPVLDQAEQLLYHGDPDAAKKMLLDWEKANKQSPARDRALFLIAEAEFQADDRIKAFYYLDELMDSFPESKLFYPALEKQYQIADDFLNGHKIRFLGMALFDAQDEAVEMLYRVQQRSPGSALAERSLLRTADYYYSDSQYDLARDAYSSYIRSYPRSPNIPRVRLHRAFASLAQFRGLLFDPTGVIDARAELVDIQRDYPQMAADENIQGVIDRIDSTFARKILATGSYYERVHDPKAAVYHYRYLTETYPDAPEAQAAQQRLARMPKWALTDPAPPAGEGYAPATQPAADTR